MSKRNKNKNKHTFQSSNKEEGKLSEGVVETGPVTLDKHLDDLALQSVKTSSDIATVKEITEEEGSNRSVWAFFWGLAIGAILVFVFL